MEMGPNQNDQYWYLNLPETPPEPEQEPEPETEEDG
jgi:hypothetical protein